MTSWTSPNSTPARSGWRKRRSRRQRLTESPVSLLAPRAIAKGLRIDAVLDETLPDALIGDAGRLRQVLLNLMSNAIKFTDRGSVTISAASPERDGGEATIVWTVSDTGIGIPADRIGLLFGEFFQADASITRRFGGSGLGLAISKRLVEQMGGTIAVEFHSRSGFDLRGQASAAHHGNGARSGHGADQRDCRFPLASGRSRPSSPHPARRGQRHELTRGGAAAARLQCAGRCRRGWPGGRACSIQPAL